MRRFVALLGAAFLVATACSQPPTTTGPSPSQETAQKGGTIVVGSTSDAKTLQPILVADTASSGVTQYIYLGMTRVNYKTGALESSLAEKFELSSDGLSLTYTIRDGLVWSDGSRFSGDDYKFTAEATLRSKKTARKSTWKDVVGYQDFIDGKTDNFTGITVGDGGKTVTIKFTKVFCPALYSLGGAGVGGIIPKSVFGKYIDAKDTTKNLDDAPENINPPLSIGPFLFKEMKPGIQVTLVRNDKYFRGAPLVDQLIIKNYADQNAIVNALKVGEVSYSGVEAQFYEDLTKVETLNNLRYPALGYNFISWNLKASNAPFLANKDVRQALWYGFNTDAVMQKLVFGLGTKIVTHGAPVQWSYDATGLNEYKYDVAKAKSLLEKAGAKMGSDGIYQWNGKPMVIQIETNQGSNTRETILQFAQDQYKQIGIQVKPLLESFPALVERSDPTQLDSDSTILGWSLGTGDPDPYQIWHSSQTHKGELNFANYSNPAVDAAIEAERNGPDCSQASRKKQFAIVQKALNEDAPYAFLYSQDSLVFSQKNLREFSPWTYGTLWNVEKIWIKQ